MTAIINGCTCMGTPDEIIRLMQLAGKVDYQVSYTSGTVVPKKGSPDEPADQQ